MGEPSEGLKFILLDPGEETPGGPQYKESSYKQTNKRKSGSYETDTEEVVIFPTKKKQLWWRTILKVCFLLFCLYMFIIAIDLFGCSIELLGSEALEKLLSQISNPFAGIIIGIYATVIVQVCSNFAFLSCKILTKL